MARKKKVEKRKLVMPDWETTMTTCKWCEKDIKYFVYKLGNSGDKRSVPRTHNGHCHEMYLQHKTAEKHQKNIAKREKKAAKESK